MTFRRCAAVGVLALLSAAGCHRQPEISETSAPRENATLISHLAPECYRFDTRIDEARITAGPAPEASTLGRGFDFTADAVPWTISEGNAHCAIAENALEIVTESEARCDSPEMAAVPASSVAAILVDVRVSGCSQFSVAWRGDAGEFVVENQVAVNAVPSNDWKQYKLIAPTLGSRERNSSPLSQLRLILPGKAKIWVRSIILASEDADRFGEKLYGLTTYSYRGSVVPSIFIRTPGALEYDLSVMPNARLTAGFLYPSPGSAKFRVLVKDGLEETVLAENQALGTSPSQQIAVDLSRLAGKKVQIRFEADSQKPGSVALWCSPALARVYPVTETTRPMNVIWYVIDALRASNVGAYGYERKTSPVIDAVAKEGVRFEWCFSPGSWTMASVPSFFTGLSPNAHGMYYAHARIPASMHLLPEILRNAGYTTALFTQNPYLSANRGFERGFDGLYKFHVRDRKAIRRGGTADTHTTNVAIGEFLREHKESPMFLYVHTLEPHHPYSPPGRLRVFTQPDGSRTTTDVYDACVLWANENLEHTINVLKEEGLWNNTLLIISADHGECLPELDGGLHGHGLEPYLPRMRIPLIMRLPGIIPEGVTIKENVQALDIPRTLFELLHIEADPQFGGMSLLGLLDGTKKAEFAERTIFPSGEKPQWQAAVKGRWYYLDNDGKGQLIDLWTNPSQSANEIAANPDVARELLEATRKYRESELAKVDQFPDSSAVPIEIDTEDRKELEALGYVK